MSLNLVGFDPAAVDPRLLVGREEEKDWLLQGLVDARELPRDQGLALCVLGEKGVGKSILTRAALHELREHRSADSMVLDVDCRNLRTLRRVLQEAARRGVTELRQLRGMPAGENRIEDEHVRAAQVLEALTRFDRLRLDEARERLERFTVGVDLRWASRLLSRLGGHFGLSLTQSRSRKLVGQEVFDDVRILECFADFLADVRGQGVHVVLYLDNLDELRHEYRDDTAREEVRASIADVMRLRHAPICLLLNCRTYFASAVTRNAPSVLSVPRLDPDVLPGLLDGRMARAVRRELRARYDRPGVRRWVAALAEMAPTPMAFLRWFKYLFEQGEGSDDPATTLARLPRYVTTSHSATSPDTLDAVAQAFELPGDPLPESRVLEACGNNRAVLAELQDGQAVLPKNFWHPNELLLDPELEFLCLPNRRHWDR